MPATSKAQFKWLHTADAKKKLGASGVKEWIDSTHDVKSLPKRAKKKEASEPAPSVPTVRPRFADTIKRK